MDAVGATRATASALVRALRWLGRLARGRVVEFVGGPARARVVALFGCVLALNSAQIATVGAVAPQLERSLHIDNTEIGLLNSVSLLVGAVAVVPVGLLVDRVRRIPMLAISILFWSAATLWGALAGSYSTLLLSRVGLGLVAATAGPAIASLTGDYFPSRERGRVYGYILSGEIAGTAAGFVVSGTAASVISWRASFVLLAIPGFFLARSLWRTVPEPLRGGYSRLEVGTQDLSAADQPPPAPPAGQAGSPPATPPAADTLDPDGDQAAATTDAPIAQPRPQEHDLAFRIARDQGYRPNPAHILDRDPDTMGLIAAVRFIMRIPTNLLLIISSSLGYYFFSGLQTFAIVFVRGHYGASQATATLMLGVLVVGSLLGTLISGPLTDVLTHRGRLESRVWVPAVCYLGASVALVPGLLSGSLGTAIWFDFIGTALISAANPPLDAARLDIMPSGLWGRAESTRTFLRSLAQALAPILFGAVADLVAGFEPEQTPVGTRPHGIVSSSTGTGLQVSFLVMLATLIAAGIFLLRARHTYPTDVATAGAGWNPDSPSEAPTRPHTATAPPTAPL